MHALTIILTWLVRFCVFYDAGLFILFVIAFFSSKEDVVSNIFKYGWLYPLVLMALPFVLLIDLIVEGSCKFRSFVSDKYYDIKYAIRDWRRARIEKRNRRVA
jgi:hypothetical protein